MKELTLEAKIDNLGPATDFVNAELEAMDCPMKAQMQINLVIDELYSNIAYYAYAPGTGDVTIRIDFQEDPRAAVISFIDRGVAYDPLKKDDPDTSLPAEDRQMGGLGIFLVKKTMDAIWYEYKDGQNITTIKKMI